MFSWSAKVIYIYTYIINICLGECGACLTTLACIKHFSEGVHLTGNDPRLFSVCELLTCVVRGNLVQLHNSGLSAGVERGGEEGATGLQERRGSRASLCLRKCFQVKQL